MRLDQCKPWQNLVNSANRLKQSSLSELIYQDPYPQRFENYSLADNNLLFDFSKQLVDQQVMNELLELANYSNLAEKITALFSGAIVNLTEQRPALHVKLRMSSPGSEVLSVQQKIAALVEQLHTNTYPTASNKPITDVISLGIGGSDLGPLMACKALEAYRETSIKVHFLSNVDGESLDRLLVELNREQTICIVNSKTFTTVETMHNASVIKQWLGDNNLSQFIAVTANPKLAQEFGVHQDNIFEFWDWVGGRYSIWSAVGMTIAILIGMDNFEKMLAGANSMDQHFQHTPLEKNIPVIMGLIGIWNINFLKSSTLAIIPYLDSLRFLPSYLQQLEMESNGKSASDDGGFVSWQTAPIIWGGVGCNGQHAYMQLLHQGPNMVPVDFILAAKSHSKHQHSDDLLIASCLGQSQALAQGQYNNQQTINKGIINIESAKACPGSRPSSTIVVPKLSPFHLGQLLSLYEHKVYVQGIIWQIQSFDQWGVELGKKLINQLHPAITSGNLEELDLATMGLAKYIDRLR